MYGARDVRVETVPDAKIVEPTEGYRAMNERETIKVMIEF
jgi:hypothetical protein